MKFHSIKMVNLNVSLVNVIKIIFFRKMEPVCGVQNTNTHHRIKGVA